MSSWTLLTMGLILYAMYLSNKDILSKVVIKYIKLSMIILCEILFMPTFDLFITVFECSNEGGENIMIVTQDTSLPIGCYSNLHIFLIVLNIVCIIFFLLLLAIQLLFLYEVRLNYPTFYNSKYSNDLDIFNVFTKIIIAISFLALKVSIYILYIISEIIYNSTGTDNIWYIFSQAINFDYKEPIPSNICAKGNIYIYIYIVPYDDGGYVLLDEHLSAIK